MSSEDRIYILKEMQRLVLVESIAFRIESCKDEELRKAFGSLHYMRNLHELELVISDYDFKESELSRLTTKLVCKLSFLSV